MSSMVTKEKAELTPLEKVAIREQIKKLVPEVFKVSWADICSSRRFRSLMWARFAVAGHLLTAGFASTRVGELLGGRDHSTALHAAKQSELLRMTNSEYAEMYERSKPVMPQRTTAIPSEPQVPLEVAAE